MKNISVEIIRFVEGGCPGWVECLLSDAEGSPHRFVDKVPVVSDENLLESSSYPCKGLIACEVEEQWQDGCGQMRVRVCTERLWGVETTDGTTRFVLLQSALVA